MKPLRVTTPVSNILQHDPDAYREYLGLVSRFSAHSWEFSPFLKNGGKNLVAWSQSFLGKQDRTFTGEFRSYLWERENYTLWVANGKGVCIEVLPEITPREALAAVREAYGIFGL